MRVRCPAKGGVSFSMVLENVEFNPKFANALALKDAEVTYVFPYEKAFMVC